MADDRLGKLEEVVSKWREEIDAASEERATEITIAFNSATALSQRDAALAEADARVRDIERVLMQRDEDIDKGSTRIAELEGHLAAAQDELAGRLAERTAAQERIALLEGEREELAAQLETTRLELDSATRRAVQGEQSVAQLVREINEQAGIAETAQDRAAKLEVQAENLNDMIEAQREENGRAAARIAELEPLAGNTEAAAQYAAELETRAAELQAALEAHRLEAREAAARVAQLEPLAENAENAAQRIAELEGRVTGWKSKAESRHQESEEIARRAVALEEEAGRLSQKLAARSTEAEDAARRAAELEEQTAQLRAELDGARQQAAEAAERAGELEDAMVNMSAELETRQRAADTATVRVAERERQLAEAVAERDAEAKDREGTTRVATKDWETVHIELEEVRSQLSDSRDEITEVRRQLAAHPPLGQVEELQLLLEEERSRAALLEEQLGRHEPVVEDTAQTEQLTMALRDRDEAHQEIVSLRAEIDMLRRANASLSTPVPVAPHGPPEAADEVGLNRLSSEGHKRRMGELLVELGIITLEQLDNALDEQSATPHRRIGTILTERGYTEEEVISQVLAHQLELPFVRLSPDTIEEAAPRMISAELARRHLCIPVSLAPDRVVLAMANPFDLVAADDVQIATTRRTDTVVATPSDVRAAIKRHYGVS